MLFAVTYLELINLELIRQLFRAIIFYNFRRSLSRQECIDDLESLYGDKATFYTYIHISHKHPKSGKA